MSIDIDQVHEQVRARYAQAATAVSQGQGCGCGSAGKCCEAEALHEPNSDFGAPPYGDAQRETLPANAVAASLGCGNPVAVADLQPGDVVLDLGSGGGIDVILSARRVGPTGKAYGVDMTDEMLELARRNAAEAAVDNVEFLKGTIEDLPMPDGTVDVVISNCVINLAADKRAVFAEMARVLRAGGRIGVSDVVAEDRLSPAERAQRGDYTGCIAGALSVSEYTSGLRDAGFVDPVITFTHSVADGLHAAIVRAQLPAATCCESTARSGCCAPAAKQECCGAAATSAGGCGCQ